MKNNRLLKYDNRTINRDCDISANISLSNQGSSLWKVAHNSLVDDPNQESCRLHRGPDSRSRTVQLYPAACWNNSK